VRVINRPPSYLKKVRQALIENVQDYMKYGPNKYLHRILQESQAAGFANPERFTSILL
jgi:hypothetical protein